MAERVSLDAALEDYALFRNITTCSTYHMSRSVALFGEWLGRQALVEDLEARQVSKWLVHLQNTGRGYSLTTVAGHRTKLLCLWRFCADRWEIDPPHRVRDVRRPDPAPISWTLDELRAVLRQCGLLGGYFATGDRRAVYCATLVKFCYESGLRRSDVWRIDRQQIRPDGSIVLRQNKTGGTHCPRVRPDTVAALRLLVRNRPLACPFKSTGDFYKFWKRDVITPAGVRNGALQQIRRTGATHLAIEHPDSVQQYLGHKTAIMQRHYVDASIATPQHYLPPSLGDDPNDKAKSVAVDPQL